MGNLCRSLHHPFPAMCQIMRHRKCVATGIYVVSDVYSENDWKLGWEGNDIKRAVGAVIDMIIESIR